MGYHRQVAHEVVDAANLYGKGDAEGHGEHDQQRGDDPCGTHLRKSRQEIADEIDEWHTRHDKQRTGHQWMPRRGRTEGRHLHRQQSEEPCDNGRDECCHSSIHIHIAAPLVEQHAQPESDDGSDRGVDESHPVATELHAEAPTGHSASDSSVPRYIVALPLFDCFEFTVKLFERIVAAQGFPRQMAHPTYHVEIHAMLLHPLELRERALRVA